MSLSAGSERVSPTAVPKPDPGVSPTAPVNVRQRLKLLKNKPRRRSFGGDSDTEGVNSEPATEPAPAAAPLGVMDSNGNLVLDGEYTGPDAFHAQVISRTLSRERGVGLRRGVLRRAPPLTQAPAKLTWQKGTARKTESDADFHGRFDPVTGEFMESCSPKAAVKVKVKALSIAPAATEVVPTVSTADKSQHLVSFEDAAELPDAFPTPVSETQSVACTVTCPSCSRKFNETAGARHIKICKRVFVEKPAKVRSLEFLVEYLIVIYSKHFQFYLTYTPVFFP